MENNVVIASFGCGKTAKTRAIYQYDYGMILKLEGVELPTAYEVHFSNSLSGETIPQIGNADGVEIPNNVLTSGANVYVWVYLHAGTNDGETVYHVQIPVTKRPEIGGAEPTPAQADVISEAIAALNDGVERAEAAADGIEETVAEALQAAKDSGEFDGPPGPQGLPGTPGADGISPTVEVTETTTGAIISVTDAEGTTTALVRNGQNGAPGTPGAPGEDGVSPTISITDISGGHRITITDAEGAHSFDVMDGDSGDAPVQDVQVNGTSVVQNGVANVPIAAVGIPGVIIVGTGLSIGSTGILRPNGGSANDRRAGTNNYIPTVMSTQHESTFYGLAKAAGDTTQSQSSNDVGTYTDEAKQAIKTMLDIPTKTSDLTNDSSFYVKPSTGIPASDLNTALVSGIDNKADKVLNATSGNIATLDSNGNLVDSGHAPSEYLTEHQDLTGYVKNTDYASNSSAGVVSIYQQGGLYVTNTGRLQINGAGEQYIKAGTNVYYPIVPSQEHAATFYGLAKAAGDTTQSQSSNEVGTYTESAKSAISTMLNGSVAVTGTTPTITALSGIQYVCGEVSTLDIIPPASGCFDVIFESGSTPTALNISNPTGTTVEWLDDLDPTNLSANTVYEINLLRMGTRYLGVAGSWS